MRHPAVLAMEIAGISLRLPRAVPAGMGLGLPEWLRQTGRMPEQAGGRASRERVVDPAAAGRRDRQPRGQGIPLDNIAITHPALEHVPIAMGVSGPMLLRLAGELADRQLLWRLGRRDYIRFARERGRRRGCAGRPPADADAYSTVAMTCVDEDGARAGGRAADVGFLAEFGVNTMTDAYGISD